MVTGGNVVKYMTLALLQNPLINKERNPEKGLIAIQASSLCKKRSLNHQII